MNHSYKPIEALPRMVGRQRAKSLNRAENQKTKQANHLKVILVISNLIYNRALETISPNSEEFTNLF